MIIVATVILLAGFAALAAAAWKFLRRPPLKEKPSKNRWRVDNDHSSIDTGAPDEKVIGFDPEELEKPPETTRGK